MFGTCIVRFISLTLGDKSLKKIRGKLSLNAYAWFMIPCRRIIYEKACSFQFSSSSQPVTFLAALVGYATDCAQFFLCKAGSLNEPMAYLALPSSAHYFEKVSIVLHYRSVSASVTYEKNKTNQGWLHQAFIPTCFQISIACFNFQPPSLLSLMKGTAKGICIVAAGGS